MHPRKPVDFKKYHSQFLCFLILFGTAIVYNALSPYTTDDFSYMYSFSTGERITSLFEVFPSMVTHYKTMNGRTAAHFLVQCMLMIPKPVFNVINALMFTAFVFLIYRLTSSSKQFRPLLFFTIPICLWINTPVFGQVFLWVTGSVNYYWAYVTGLLFFSFYLKLYRTGAELSKASYVTLCILGFFFGGYSENTSFSVIFTVFLLLAAGSFSKKDWKFFFKYTLPILFGAAGYLTILLSPASADKIGGFSIGTLFHNLIELLTAYYTRHQPSLIILAVLFVIAWHYKIEKKELFLALAYFFISILSVAMLSATSYLADRSLGCGAVFLTIAIFQLMQALRKNTHTECIAYCLAAYFIVSNLLVVWDGSYDIYDVYRQNSEREAYIEEQKLQGATEVTVPIIYPLTKYSNKYILSDLTTAEHLGWPNGDVARYYGLEKIYGKEPWEY